MLGQYTQPTTTPTIGQLISPDPDVLGSDPITIGEALEASALGAGDKPVDQSDASAIQAAEAATGMILPGGIGAIAQSAATHNFRTSGDEEKTTLSDVLEVKIHNSFDSFLSGILEVQMHVLFSICFDNIVGILLPYGC